jgi:hypothetical protein
MNKKNTPEFTNTPGVTPIGTDQYAKAIVDTKMKDWQLNIQLGPDILHPIIKKLGLPDQSFLTESIPEVPVNTGKSKSKFSARVTIKDNLRTLQGYMGDSQTTTFTEDDRERMERIEKKLDELALDIKLLLDKK